MTKLIIALDNMTIDRAIQIAYSISRTFANDEFVWGFKGNDILDLISREQFREFSAVACKEKNVFADPKFNDIPRTVINRAQKFAMYGADIITVHASGGIEMMEQANAIVHPGYVAAVGVLTSLSEEECHHIFNDSPMEKVLQFTADAREAGLDHIVCSPLEVRAVKEWARSQDWDVECFVPGIRLAGSDIEDQARHMTPAEAAAAGADHIIVGSDITKHEKVSGMIEVIEAIKDEVLAAPRLEHVRNPELPNKL